MRFEKALEAMRDGEEVGLELSSIDVAIFHIKDGKIQRLHQDGEFSNTYLDSEEILSNDWYVRRVR